MDIPEEEAVMAPPAVPPAPKRTARQPNVRSAVPQTHSYPPVQPQYQPPYRQPVYNPPVQPQYQPRYQQPQYHPPPPKEQPQTTAGGPLTEEAFAEYYSLYGRPPPPPAPLPQRKRTKKEILAIALAITTMIGILPGGAPSAAEGIPSYLIFVLMAIYGGYVVLTLTRYQPERKTFVLEYAILLLVMTIGMSIVLYVSYLNIDQYPDFLKDLIVGTLILYVILVVLAIIFLIVVASLEGPAKQAVPEEKGYHDEYTITEYADQR